MIVLQHRITHSIGRGELCVPVDVRRRYQRLGPTDRLVDRRLLRESQGVAYSLRGVYGLLRLPSDSPELNPVEGLWADLKSH